MIVAAVGFLAAFAIADWLTAEDSDDTPAAAGTSAAAGTTGVDATPSRPVIVTVDAAPTDSAEDQRPIDPDAERRRAPCPAREFRLVFDRQSGAAVVFSNDGQPLASIGLTSRSFDQRLCPARLADAKALVETERPATYESGSTACTASGEIDIEINPTVDSGGRQTGNVLVVSEQGGSDLLVSAIVVEGLQGRRVHYSDPHCEPL